MAVQKLSAHPIRWVLNTGVDADHVGGNASVAHILGSSRHVELVNTPFSSAVQNVEIVGSQAVLDRMGAPEGKRPAFPSEAWPTETFAGEKDEVFYNGEAIEMFHAPAAHTDAISPAIFALSDAPSSGAPTLFPPHTRTAIRMRRRRADPNGY